MRRGMPACSTSGFPQSWARTQVIGPQLEQSLRQLFGYELLRYLGYLYIQHYQSDGAGEDGIAEEDGAIEPSTICSLLQIDYARLPSPEHNPATA